jgi:hypothetical protein
MVKRLAMTAAAAFALTAGTAQAQTYFDVAKVPQPSPTEGKRLVDDIDAFATAFANRITGTTIEMNAGNALKAKAEKLGYQVEVRQLRGPLRVVLATRKGTTKPDEQLLFIGHYDNFPQSNTGHYDNGSGTLMLEALARQFQNVPTNRTITFAWYNGEEEGALASDVHAKELAAAGAKIRSVFGFDMVGISYPVANPEPDVTCLCMWWGDEDEGFEGVLRKVNYDVLGFPEGDGLVQVVGSNDRNSDEASFDTAGYPTLRWAGMRNAADYPQYHDVQDNLATMESVAGSRSNLEQGMFNTLRSSYNTALALDNEMPVAKATSSGERTIAFDGSGSSDPDGAIKSYTWDFGDGSTGTGAKAEHTYAKPGTYAAKLTVADNLHPTVTSTAIVPVTIGGTPGVALGNTSNPAAKKPSCSSKARKIKSAKKRKAALRKCARSACVKKAKKIKNASKRKAALRRCAKKR